MIIIWVYRVISFEHALISIDDGLYNGPGILFRSATGKFRKGR